MNARQLDFQLQTLLRILAINLLIVAEISIWSLYTAWPPSAILAEAWSFFATLSLLVLGFLLTKIIWALGNKTSRLYAARYLIKTLVSLGIWLFFVVLTSWRLLQLKNFEMVDGQVLVEESLSTANPGATADSTQYSVGTQTAQPISTPTPKTAPKPINNDPFANDPYLKNVPWGTTVEIAPHTYRTKIAEDSRMSTVPELYNALNVYRQAKGKNPLRIDDFLVKLADVRVDQIPTETEAHKGFIDIMNQTNPSAYEEYGNFQRFGENFSRGYTLSGTHLIEWVYAGDPGHDSNQLGDWNAVGIAIKGTTTVLEFGWK